MSPGDWAPTDEVLIAFESGLLSEAEIDAVASWLESSPDGEEQLARADPAP